MAFNGSGTYVLPGAALATGAVISSSEHNTFRSDVATALTTCVTRDGQSPATDNLPMGGNKLTGLAAGSTAGDSVRFEQIPTASSLGLVIGTNVQAYSANLDEYAAVNPTAAGLALLDDADAAAQRDTLGGVGFTGFRNKIINGNFSVNQRLVSGTVTLSAGAYGHDRFKAGAGGCTYTFATSLGVTTLTISAGTLQQVIEGNNLFSGAHTLSWVGTATGRVDSGSYGATGVAGTAVGGTNQTVEFSTGTLSKVQYEPGSVATPFENRPYGVELALCQRYYFRWAPASTSLYFAVGFASSTTNSGYYVKFPVTMRSNPTCGRSAFADLSLTRPTDNTSTAATSSAGDNIDANGGVINYTSAAFFTAGGGCTLKLSNSAGWIDFSAEL